ncbi:unnamed protein product [Ectocarpus sp. 6 AP-2014]
MGGSEGIVRAIAGGRRRQRRGLVGPGKGQHGHGKRGSRGATLREEPVSGPFERASSLRHGRSQLQERTGGCGRRSVREGGRAQPQAGPDGSGPDVHRLRHAGASEGHLQATPPKGKDYIGLNSNNAVHQLAYGELCEALNDEEGARDAYDEALRVDPGMGKAHFRKALLLTGTGVTNQAALHAFGLNAEEAKHHLREAVASGEEGTAISAAEALKWCEMEEREVQEWSRALREDPQETRERLPGERRDRQGEGGIGTGGDRTGRRNEPAGEGGKREGAASAWVEEAGGYLSLPEVEISGPGEFMEAFVNKSKPAVIKNFQDGFAPKEAWSWTALSERFGDSMVRVSLSETGRFDGPEPGDMWGLAPGDEVLVRPPATSMAFSDFVRLLRQEGIKETFYLEYLALHQYLGTPMAEMVPLPTAAAESGLELLLTNLWVGKGGTTAVLHYDDYENLLCQVRGTKELVLFPPKDLENLYYVGRRKGKLKYHFPGKWTRDELDGPNKVIFSSSVRLDDPDFERHPRLKRCRPYRVVLQEGDVLYMPAFWHHEVRSYPDAEEGNVAVNFWFRNVTSFAEEERDVLGIGGEPSRTEL